MEHELQKGDQGRGGKALETVEKAVNTLPELEPFSEIVKGDKDMRREIDAVLNDENEDINTIIDDDYNIKENESKKEEYTSNSDSREIDIVGSIEKQVFELDDNCQAEMRSNTELSLTGSKEKKDITLDNVSITEKSKSDDEIVETVLQVDKNVDKKIDKKVDKAVDTLLEIESFSKTENDNDKPTPKSLETDKITVQNLETNEITFTDTVTTKKEVTEVSPDQTLAETITLKGNKDKISKEMNFHSAEVKDTTEDNVKESTTEQETIAAVDETIVTLVVKDNSIINKVTSNDLDNEDAHDKSRIDVVIAAEIREEKPQLEDNDDEDLETPTPSTPESGEDLITTISKVAPELVSVVRDLKQVSDKLDPIKRSWNDLKLRKSLEDVKSEEDKLVQKAIDYIKEAMIKKVEFENQEVDQEGEVYYTDDESGSPPKRIKIEINWDDIYEREGLLSNPQIQTLIQPTSSSPSSIVTDVLESMITPGFNNNVVLAMNICFWLLFAALIFLAILSNYDYMVLLNLGISILLYISLCWFIVVTRTSQVEEAAKIAKKED